MKRLTTSEARRQDTREKIELGGLIVKAGLRYEKRALLLGLLIDAGIRLDEDEERDRLTAIGAQAFGMEIGCLQKPLSQNINAVNQSC